MNADSLKKEIKKVKIGHIALLCTGIFLAFAIIGSILIAAGGGWLVNNGFRFNWNDIPPVGPGQLFDVNDRFDFDLDGVDRIEIVTISDDVNVKPASGKVVAELKGQCRSATKPKWLEARKAGNTLYIEVKYPQSVNNSNTSLTVTIPAEYAGDLKVVTVSGELYADGLPLKLDEVNIHTVSGDVYFSTASYADLKADTTSGEVKVSGIMAATNVKTVSGDVSLDYTAFVATTVKTVSGEVRASIPQTSAFKVDFNSVSGDFTANHSGLGVDRAKDGFSGSTPDGKELFKVNTTSGDLSIDGK